MSTKHNHAANNEAPHTHTHPSFTPSSLPPLAAKGIKSRHWIRRGIRLAKKKKQNKKTTMQRVPNVGKFISITAVGGGWCLLEPLFLLLFFVIAAGAVASLRFARQKVNSI